MSVVPYNECLQGLVDFLDGGHEDSHLPVHGDELLFEEYDSQAEPGDGVLLLAFVHVRASFDE